MQSCVSNARKEKNCQLKKSSRKISSDCFSEPECEQKCSVVKESVCSINQEQECKVVRERKCQVVQEERCNTVQERQCNTVRETECQTGENKYLPLYFTIFNKIF
jgi:hypothetical protein